MFKWNKLMNLRMSLSVSGIWFNMVWKNHWNLEKERNFQEWFKHDVQLSKFSGIKEFLVRQKKTFAKIFSLASSLELQEWIFHLRKGTVGHASIHLSTVCWTRSSGNEVIYSSTPTNTIIITHLVHHIIMWYSASKPIELQVLYNWLQCIVRLNTMQCNIMFCTF